MTSVTTLKPSQYLQFFHSPPQLTYLFRWELCSVIYYLSFDSILIKAVISLFKGNQIRIAILQSIMSLHGMFCRPLSPYFPSCWKRAFHWCFFLNNKHWSCVLDMATWYLLMHRLNMVRAFFYFYFFLALRKSILTLHTKFQLRTSRYLQCINILVFGARRKLTFHTALGGVKIYFQACFVWAAPGFSCESQASSTEATQWVTVGTRCPGILILVSLLCIFFP